MAFFIRVYVPHRQMFPFIVASISSSEGLELVEHFGNSIVYRNKFVLPRAWIQALDDPIGVGVVPVTKLTWNPNRISLAASGPGLLVLSEIYYPGWQVRVDGQPSEIKDVNQILRAVVLDEGNHNVTFYFNPISIYLGLVFFILGLILVGTYLWKQKSRNL